MSNSEEYAGSQNAGSRNIEVALPEDERGAIGLVAQSVAEQQTLKLSAGGSAEFLRLEDEDAITQLHPYSVKWNDIVHRLGPIDFAAPVHALPTEIGPFSTGSITFNNGVPVGGWASLDLRSDGSYTFSGHFHDSGAPSYNVEFVWVIVDSGGQAYSFSANGRMHGTFESGSRDYNWSVTNRNPLIAQRWAQLNAGWRWQWNAHVNWNVQAALDSVINALKTAGAVIGAVAAIVALV